MKIPVFWLVLQEPRRVPERKGPWPLCRQATILREFMDARPSAYIQVLTVGEDGVPEVQHGPELLTMIDGRSAPKARRHNASVAQAHATGTARLRSCVEDAIKALPVLITMLKSARLGKGADVAIAMLDDARAVIGEQP